MGKTEMIERVEPKAVQAAGKKILELADRERWPGPVLLCTLVALFEFLEDQGFEEVSRNDEFNRN